MTASVVVTPGTAQHVTVQIDPTPSVVAGTEPVPSTTTLSTQRVDVRELGILGPQGPAGTIDVDIDQYGRLVLDGGSPNITSGA